MNTLQGILLVVLALLEAAGLAYFLWCKIGKGTAQPTNTNQLKEALQERVDINQKITAIIATMIPASELRAKGEEYKVHKESLKAERGRLAITEAELETVEGRLRELEVIERELEASSIETQEEVSILNRKKEELEKKKEGLKEQLDESSQKMAEVMNQIEMSAQMRAKIEDLQTELLNTQAQIDVLLLKIQESNQMYIIAKRRFDALDIEYAQLYEKFSSQNGGQE